MESGPQDRVWAILEATDNAVNLKALQDPNMWAIRSPRVFHFVRTMANRSDPIKAPAIDEDIERFIIEGISAGETLKKR